ncbi:hypothetical protein K458DRAFT_10623 [Lentithecium fluviatile CBS 122367]|uniref:Uncharacterized protein n=1 Tax=Lentithecium fluviatile CBS 122367 TaxID=1168545 RepID=A0A6G1JPW3_9PLEO|nr:hypothetical protein K458DRAFT_10623 [Lentithecium fluviatile CBS 122367]
MRRGSTSIACRCRQSTRAQTKQVASTEDPWNPTGPSFFDSFCLCRRRQGCWPVRGRDRLVGRCQSASGAGVGGVLFAAAPGWDRSRDTQCNATGSAQHAMPQLKAASEAVQIRQRQRVCCAG